MEVTLFSPRLTLAVRKWVRRAGLLFNQLHEIKFGASVDTLAITLLYLAGIATSPMFAQGIESSFLLLLVALMTLIGWAWINWCFVEPIREDHILDSSLKIDSAPSPYHQPENGQTKGILLGYTTDQGRPVWINDEFLMRHLFCLGQSGTGKTVFAMNLLYQQIQRGGGALFIDGKIDASNIAQIRNFCLWTGRSHDLLIINPDKPEEFPTNTYNPILWGDPDEVADRLLQLIPDTSSNAGADHYRMEAKQALNTIIAALQACDLRYNMIDLVVLLINQRAMEELERKLLVSAPDQEATKNFSLFLDKFRMPDWDRNNPGGIDMNKLKQSLGGIAGRLYTFGTGNFGMIMNSYDPDVSLYDAVRTNKIVYAALPTMGKGTTARNFGRLIIGDLRTAISWLQRLPEDERPNPPFLSLCDEAGSYVNDEWSRIPEQSRSAHMVFAPFSQTVANFQAISEELYEMVVGNSWTKIVFKVGTQGTALETAELIGMEKTVIQTLGDSESESASFQSLRAAPGLNLGKSAGATFSEREQEDYRVSPDQLKSLDMGEAVITYGHTELFSVRIPRLTFSREAAVLFSDFELNRFRPRTVRGADFFRNTDRYLAPGYIKKLQKKADEEDAVDLRKTRAKATQIEKTNDDNGIEYDDID